MSETRKAVQPTGPTTFTYNRDRQVTRLAQPGGQTLDFDYESSGGRLTNLTTPRGPISCTYHQEPLRQSA